MINFGGFWRFWKIKKSKMADPRWPPFENKALLWRHMTSSAKVVDLNWNIFGRAIFPLSFIVIALIFSELRGGESAGIRPPPGPTRPKKEFKITSRTGPRMFLTVPHGFLRPCYGSAYRDSPICNGGVQEVVQVMWEMGLRGIVHDRRVVVLPWNLGRCFRLILCYFRRSICIIVILDISYSFCFPRAHCNWPQLLRCPCQPLLSFAYVVCLFSLVKLLK